MALIHRDGRTYYYTTRRVGTRVIREYGASGRVAELGQQLDDNTRKLRRLERAIARDDLLWVHSETIAYRDWFRDMDRVIGEALEHSGWHCVRRQWRRKRGTTMTQLANVSQLSWVQEDLVEAAGHFGKELTEKLTKGDKAALKAADAYLANPAAKALWGDMGRCVLMKWAERLTGKDTLSYHAVIRFASDLRAKLAGPNGTALETIVAERVVVAWLFLQWADWQCATLAEKATIKQAEFVLKRLDLANRNLMSACRTLARVRRANLPDVLALVNVKAPNLRDIPSG